MAPNTGALAVRHGRRLYFCPHLFQRRVRPTLLAGKTGGIGSYYRCQIQLYQLPELIEQIAYPTYPTCLTCSTCPAPNNAP